MSSDAAPPPERAAGTLTTSGALDEDAFGKLGRAATRQQVARVVQVGVTERNAFGDLLRTAGLDEY